jgi:N-acetylglucosaminyldiphosphoundecaprenol N-acetyl-beta-D-mannosaminyltransferase
LDTSSTSNADTCRRAKSRRSFLGLYLNTFTQDEFLASIERSLRARDALRISFLNPFYARVAATNAPLRAAMNSFDVLQADGWGVILAARICGVRIKERVAIEDFERPFFEQLARTGSSLFLFGSEPGMAAKAAATLERSFPGLRVAGTQHGWLDVERGHPGTFAVDDEIAVVDLVNASGADAVLVGLPTPLQQDFVVTYGARLDAPIVMTVGAYFDHLAERLDWYPRWMDRLRLDWLYRLYREPARLRKRYTLGMLQFARHVLRERVHPIEAPDG